MWQAEPVTFLVIGASHLEWGVCIDRPAGVWQDCLRLNIAEPPQGLQPIQQLLEALAVLQRMLAEQPINDSPARSKSAAPGLLRVVIAERWLAMDTIPWSQALHRTVPADRYRRKCLEAAGLAITSDSVVRTDDRAFGEPCLVVAYPSTVKSALDSLTNQQNLRLASMLPLGVLACTDYLERQSKLTGGVAVVDGGWVCFFNIHDGRAKWLSSSVTVEGTTHTADLWRRLCFRHAEVSDTALTVLTPATLLDGTKETTDFSLLVSALSQTSICHPLDMVSDRSQISRSQWFAMFVCVALLSGLLTLLIVTMYRLAQLEFQITKQSPVIVPVKVLSREERQRIVAVNRAVRELNLPVDTLLKSLQPPKDIRVVLIEIDLMSSDRSDDVRIGAGRALKLMLEAGDSLDMTRYVDFLADRPSMANVHLTRHEIVESDPAKPYRFSVEVTWKD